MTSDDALFLAPALARDDHCDGDEETNPAELLSWTYTDGEQATICDDSFAQATICAQCDYDEERRLLLRARTICARPYDDDAAPDGDYENGNFDTSVIFRLTLEQLETEVHNILRGRDLSTMSRKAIRREVERRHELLPGALDPRRTELRDIVDREVLRIQTACINDDLRDAGMENEN